MPVSIVLGVVAFRGLWIDVLREPRYAFGIAGVQTALLLLCAFRDAPPER